MRVNLLFVLGCFSGLLNLYSCTKDPTGTPINPSGQIHSITYTGNSPSAVYDINEFYYNSDGTINYFTLRGINSSAYSQKGVYSYTSNLVTQTSYDSLNVALSEYKYYLRANGLVDSIVSSSIPVDSVLVSQYFYNSNNILTEAQLHNYLPGGSSGPLSSLLYTFVNGNLTRVDVPPTNKYLAYEYYDTVSNLTPHAYGLSYSLNQSSNLLKKQSFNDTGNPADTKTEFTHEYTFDSNNRVSTQTIHSYENSVATGEYVTLTYTYN